jgi:hypothetical protein
VLERGHEEVPAAQHLLEGKQAVNAGAWVREFRIVAPRPLDELELRAETASKADEQQPSANLGGVGLDQRVAAAEDAPRGVSSRAG